MKKVFKVTLIISLAVVLLSVIFVVASAFSAMNNSSGSVGIIGGADGPTAIYVTQTLIFGSPAFSVFLIAASVLIVSAIGCIITKNK